MPVEVVADDSKENDIAIQDDKSDSEGSSGTSTPAEEPAPWVQVDGQN